MRRVAVHYPRDFARGVSGLMLSVSEAAERLGVHPGRVRQLVAAGRLDAEKIGGRWLVAEDAVRARADAERPAGRPLSARAAWGMLWVAAGRPAPWLSEREERRARQRARSWSLEHWAWGCRRRADVHAWYGHPAVHAALSEDRRLVRSGASVRSVHLDIVLLDHVEGYIQPKHVDSLVEDYGLVAGGRTNVVLRVPPDDLVVFGDDRDAPWSVVAVDLLDAGDDRSVRAAFELYNSHR